MNKYSKEKAPFISSDTQQKLPICNVMCHDMIESLEELPYKKKTRLVFQSYKMSTGKHFIAIIALLSSKTMNITSIGGSWSVIKKKKKKLLPVLHLVQLSLGLPVME